MIRVADTLEQLLVMLESAGSGLAVMELADDVALAAPAASGVATFMPLDGGMYILQTDRPARRVEAGALAVVPSGAAIRLSARRTVRRSADSRERVFRRGGWIVVPAEPDARIAARVAAARIIGSRGAALDDILVMDVSGHPSTAPLFALLVAEVASGEIGHAGYAMALMNACVVQALRRSREETGDDTARVAAAPRGAIARSIAAIRADPAGAHSIDSLAAMAGMSRSTFLRGFGKATGTAPQRYLQRVRLEEAAALLGSTDLPIKSVAAMTGFLSRSHFSRAFREAFDLDPSAYRYDMQVAEVPDQTE